MTHIVKLNTQQLLYLSSLVATARIGLLKLHEDPEILNLAVSIEVQLDRAEHEGMDEDEHSELSS